MKVRRIRLRISKSFWDLAVDILAVHIRCSTLQGGPFVSQNRLFVILGGFGVSWIGLGGVLSHVKGNVFWTSKTPSLVLGFE